MGVGGWAGGGCLPWANVCVHIAGTFLSLQKATSFPGSFCIEKKDQIRRKRKEKNSFSHIQYRKNKRLLFLRIFWSVVEF